MPTRYYTPLKSGTTEHVNDNILRLRGHGNKLHATAINVFSCCNRTKLCFRVRIAKLMQQKLLKQKQLRFLNRYFQDGGHEQKHRDSICSPSFG